MIDVNDIINQKFGKLTVISFDNKIRKNNRNIYNYNCKCECGNNIITNRRALIKNEVKSCGCLIKEKSSQNGKKRKLYNKYDISSYNYGIGYTNKGEEFYFDLEDYNKIKNICWHIDSNGYVVGRYNEKYIKFHRMVMNTQENEIIDHISHIKHDNRKNNLRIVNYSQNAMNRKSKGISYRKDQNKWRVYITVNHKRIYLGNYIDKDTAILVRREAENKYFKEYKYEYNN